MNLQLRKFVGKTHLFDHFINKIGCGLVLSVATSPFQMTIYFVSKDIVL